MYKKILVPLDGSELSEVSLEHSEVIASGCSVPDVILLRVLEPIHIAEDFVNILGYDWLRDTQKRQKAIAKDYLTGMANRITNSLISVQTVLLEGDPASMILEYSADNKVDLIVMTTHSRGGLRGWTMGSVAERVTRYSTVPVLIIPPHAYHKKIAGNKK
jgi:nucleotide-binding universal stress UspA family protein